MLLTSLNMVAFLCFQISRAENVIISMNLYLNYSLAALIIKKKSNE
jgi:hypothetical protein